MAVVAASTASVMREDVVRIADAGSDGYVAEPISVREFADQVAALCALSPG